MATQQLSTAEAVELIKRVKQQSALIQCITNFVSMDLMANTLLAIGASPAMAHSLEEVEDFQKIAAGLVVNVGTLSPDWVEGMKLAAQTARSCNHPWVLDPVGAGATPFRIKTIISLLEYKPNLIRGNASEIMAVAGASGAFTKGVDSTANPDEALEAGKKLAQDVGCIVAITGAVDVVTDGSTLLRVPGGTPLLTKVTAAGCSLTAVAATFIVAAPNKPLQATALALRVFGLAAEVADKTAHGPGSLRSTMLDVLYQISQGQHSDYFEHAWESVHQ
jgi:hydroxyethylthiazole kinase